jgi:membrane fusion protein, multidrug efflux system
MKRALRWVAIGAAVLVLGAIALRTLQQRQKPPAPPPAAARTGVALELAPSDVLTAGIIELTRTLEVSGGLKATHSAFLKAKVAAEVVSLTVREGDRVSRGQILGQLDSTELVWRLRQAEQTAASAKAQAAIATRALENNRALVAQGFISPTGLETSISNDAAAQGTLEAALAAVELARKARADATLVAPIAGLVSQRLVQPGERVAIDARLIEIVDLSQLELEAAVATEDIGALSLGKPALLSIDGIDARIPAKVARINPSTQSGSRSIMAYLAVQGQPQLRQGMFATGRIELARKNTTAVPLSAVRTDGAKPHVLLLQGEQVRVREVSLGLRGEVNGQAWVEVATGLAPGERILAGSVGSIRDGTAVRFAAAPPAAGPTPGAASAAAAAR